MSGPRRNVDRSDGFTLIELLIVLGILVGFLAMLVQFVDIGVRLFDSGEAGQALADRTEVARIAVERELRSITADCRRVEPGVPPDRLLVQQLPFGLPARATADDPRAFCLRAGIALSPLEEERLRHDAMLARAYVELGVGADRAAVTARAQELEAASGLRGRGRLLLAQWPETTDGALIELRVGRFLPDQMIQKGDAVVDPFAVPVPGSGELTSVLLHTNTDLLVGGLLHAELQLWSQATTGWEQTGPNGPELVWDSARAGWLSDPADGPVFRFDRDAASLLDPTDDVHPRALRVTLVVAEDQNRPPAGLLADPLERDGNALQLVNGDAFPGDEGGGFVKVEGEWVRYASRDGDTLRGLQRGQRGTRAKEHAGGAALRVGRTVQFTVMLPHGKDDWNG
jgi:prepilin-type N-terminal cleavage/methylation domain-containing protein